MSLSLILDDLRRPTTLFDQNFGLGLLPDDLIDPHTILRMMGPPRSYYRPYRFMTGRDSGLSTIASTDDEFKVNLDVQQFSPENLNVKVVDNHVIIEGKHEERQDEHGYISRQFTRRYVLPPTVDPTQVVSSLSSDGVLSISAPKKAPPLPQNERVVPIVQTQQPALPRGKGKADKAGGDTEKMEQ